MVQLGIRKDNALDRYVTSARRHLTVQVLNLVAHIGRCVKEEPVRTVRADRDG
jgi:hypothetical protein